MPIESWKSLRQSAPTQLLNRGRYYLWRIQRRLKIPDADFGSEAAGACAREIEGRETPLVLEV
ncbi:hypothetical protein BH20ACI3_BH20ACI3_03280 [soil metagenome]